MHPIPQALAGHEPVPRMSWLIVALGIITAIGPLSIDMYLPAFNDISESLGSDMAHVQYSLTTYFIGLSLGQLFYGPIADRFGRKRPLQFGMCLYIAASIGCAFATNIETLVLMRCLQALGAAAGAVITRAMVRDRFSPNHAARVFSLLMMIMGVAPILAPLLGGFITGHFGWRAIFWFLTFVSAACFIVSLRLPETREPHLRLKSLSFKSVIITYGKIIRNRHFLGYSFISGMAMAGMFTYITSSPFVLMMLNGIDKEHFGWFFGANATGFVIASQLNARVLVKHSFNEVLLRATAVLFLSGLGLLVSQIIHAPFAILVALLFIFVGSLGFIMPNASAGALAEQAEHAGAASALSGTMLFVFASGTSSLVSYLENGSSIPMVAIMAICASLAAASFHFLVKPRIS